MRVLAATALAGAVVFTAGCGQAPPPVSERVQAYYDENVALAKATATRAAAKDVSFAAVGDSVTEADSPNVIAGLVGPGSWIKYAAGDGVTYAGGWADGGARSESMAANVKPVKADVLVVLAGTNDFGNNVPFSESAANIITIVKTVGAKRVIVSATPPSDSMPAEGAAYNTELQAFAKGKGWTWVDATAKLRTKDNTYISGLTLDGTHPTAEAARMIGESIRAAILKG